MRLAGRRIVVTGAASGIGLATARLFHAQGARVAMFDIDANALADIDFDDGDTLRRACDVTDAAAVEDAMSRAAARFDGLDGVVNAAGIDLVRAFPSLDVAAWERVFSINVTGPMLVCKAAIAAFAGPGTIVNISSAAGLTPLRERTAYCASKAALGMFTKALALEMAPRGVRANVLCPGVIDTPMLRASYENAPDPDAAYREVSSRNAFGRVGEADDIAEAALYLSSTESRFVTGTTLVVDGGRAFH